jgi:D-alanyl-D-alanine dipeptidase
MILPVTHGVLGAHRTRTIAASVARAEALRPGYRSHAMDAGAPEQTHAMVELRDLGIAGENYYHSPHNPPYHGQIAGSVPSLLLRAPLAARLQGVNETLAPYGLELWVFDAWRPIAVQNHFHDHWMPAHLRRQNPSLEGAALQAEVEKYWARGAPGGIIDPTSPPPHATGAAVDLTIRRTNGAHLFMGSIFDDVTAVSNTAHFETATDAMSFSAIEARDNRRMLFWLMADAGFSNNSTEWWHFSCGDQMWARSTGAPAAHYGPAPV